MSEQKCPVLLKMGVNYPEGVSREDPQNLSNVQLRFSVLVSEVV
jgi:hypothetical protein